MGKDGNRYRIGIWDSDTESETSNFREFENVVETLEEEAEKGNLRGAEVFMCTDNSTVESALYRGTSSSKKRFSLVVRLRKLEMQEQAHILVSHVSGVQMMAEGTDGTSRGQLKEGVSVGENLLGFIPWNENGLERTEALKPWLESGTGKDIEFFDPRRMVHPRP